MSKKNKNSESNHQNSKFSESSFIEWLSEKKPYSDTASISIGDDAACVKMSTNRLLIATDMLLDGIHFDSTMTDPGLIGRKAMAVNLSDIAAMGGVPLSAYISLGIPKNRDLQWIKRVMNGAIEIAQEFNCTIDGGDTNTWPGKFTINICIIGTPHWRGPVTRKGARAGDVVMVSGGSLGNTLNSNHHLTFQPRIQEAQWLLDHFHIHSMMDISDGLASDLPKLAKASCKKITLNRSLLMGHYTNEEDYVAALCDGEDFELLFTCDQNDATELIKHFPWPCGVRSIGVVEHGDGVFIQDDQSQSLKALTLKGFEHRT